MFCWECGRGDNIEIRNFISSKTTNVRGKFQITFVCHKRKYWELIFRSTGKTLSGTFKRIYQNKAFVQIYCNNFSGGFIFGIVGEILNFSWVGWSVYYTKSSLQIKMSFTKNKTGRKYFFFIYILGMCFFSLILLFYEILNDNCLYIWSFIAIVVTWF